MNQSRRSPALQEVHGLVLGASVATKYGLIWDCGFPRHDEKVVYMQTSRHKEICCCSNMF